MKSTAYLADVLLNPATSHSEEEPDCASSRVFKTKSYFEHLYAPGNEHLTARVRAVLERSGPSKSPAVVPGGFPWETLPKGTKVVDVGGGIGVACHKIMKENPFLKFTVQDLPAMNEGAVAYWNTNEPKAIADGQVTIQAHDFFAPQPVNDAGIFLLGRVLHNWKYSKAVEILKRLREAAVPGKTRVVAIDLVVRYVCTADWKLVPGAEDIVFEEFGNGEVPEGLLPNLGRAGAESYYYDISSMATMNSKERTLGDHIQLMEAGGWKIKKIYTPGGGGASHILAEPI